MNIQSIINDDGSVDLTGKQGSTWKFTLEIKQPSGSAMDLTGYTARGQIRKTCLSKDIIKSFTCTILNPATDGKIEVFLSATNTAQIKAGESETESASIYVYDIEIESAGGEVSRILEGKLFVDPEVTK